MSRKRNQGLIASAVDDNGNIHAAIFVVWDSNSAYQIKTAVNPNYRGSGASTFIVWEVIKKLSKITKSWDFTGSMFENVNLSVREFGTTQTPYFKISKYIKPITILKEICNI